jgi:hypothetical protein
MSTVHDGPFLVQLQELRWSDTVLYFVVYFEKMRLGEEPWGSLT